LGQTGVAPEATSMMVEQRGHLRRGMGVHRTIPAAVLKAFQPLAASMPDITHDDQAIEALLRRKPRIAMVGASDNPARDSNRVFLYMQRHGYHQVPVNPTTPEVGGVKTVPDLAAAAKLGPVDLVDVFRAADQVGPVVDAAIAVKAKGIWFQLGVVNPAAIQKAIDAGLDVIVDRCIKIEHARLGL
jgi:predicted CoA-binding protein